MTSIIIVFALLGFVFTVLGIAVFVLKSEKDTSVWKERSKQPQQGLAVTPDDTMTRYQNQVDQVRVDILEAVKAYYDPGRGRFTSWWQKGKAEGRHRLSEALNNEQISVIQQGALLEEHMRKGLENEAAFRTFITQNAAILNEIRIKQALIESALTHGFTLETDQAVKLESELAKIRLDEHKQRNDFDLEKRWEEILQDSNAADLASIGDHLVIKKLRQELREAREERHGIRKSDDYDEDLRKELLGDYNKFIKRLEAAIDERETGHLLSANGKAQKGPNKGPANRRAEYPAETTEDAN